MGFRHGLRGVRLALPLLRVVQQMVDGGRDGAGVSAFLGPVRPRQLVRQGSQDRVVQSVLQLLEQPQRAGIGLHSGLAPTEQMDLRDLSREHRLGGASAPQPRDQRLEPALARVRDEIGDSPQVEKLVRFLEKSERGFIR